MTNVLRVSVFIASVAIPSTYASDYSRARNIWDRVVGSYRSSDEAKVFQMEQLLAQNQAKAAVAIATAEKRFIDYTIARLATPWSNREAREVFDYNAMIALIQGTVRDKRDFRAVFYGNYLYRVDPTRVSPTITIPAISLSQENHFLTIPNNDLSAFDVLTLQSGNQYSTSLAGLYADFSGVFTLSTAKFLYDAGTNRRPVEWAVKTMLCKTMNEIFDTNRGDRFVARDVDRSDVEQYRTKCIGCHGAALDGMRDAFAFVNTLNGALSFKTSINFSDATYKYNSNSSIFPEGHITTGNGWVNLATANHNSALGWRGATSGTGIAALAKMIADSEEFSRCMATQVFEQACLRSPTENERTRLIASIAVIDFEREGYQLNKLYEAIAADASCIGE